MAGELLGLISCLLRLSVACALDEWINITAGVGWSNSGKFSSAFLLINLVTRGRFDDDWFHICSIDSWICQGQEYWKLVNCQKSSRSILDHVTICKKTLVSKLPLAHKVYGLFDE